MFCNNCGKEIADDAVMCVGCGRAVQPLVKAVGTSGEWNGGPFAGLLVGAILIPLIGFIAGIIGLTSEGKRGQGAALLVTGIVMFFVWAAILAH